jgi:intein/homing endonuclease
MKLSNLSSLNAHYVKRIGLIFASLFISLEIIAKLTGVIEEIDLRLINLYIIASLGFVAFSKEKVDDERSQIIRYFSLKFTFKLLIAGIATIYCFKINIEPIYIAISSLIAYLVTYYLASYYNPEFIFKEETKNNVKGIKFIVGIMTFIGFAFLYNIIKTLIGF